MTDFLLFVLICLIATPSNSQVYGILDAGEYKDFELSNQYSGQVSLQSFQGPIKFAKVKEDGSLSDIDPLSGTYLFYDYIEEIRQKLHKNTSTEFMVQKGRLNSHNINLQIQFNISLSTKSFDYIIIPDLKIYQNQSIQHKSEDGYLIIDIPILLYKNGSYIKSIPYDTMDSYYIFYGDKQDEQSLKLIGNKYENSNLWPKTAEQDFVRMSYSNFILRVYHKLDQNKKQNYFAVTTGFGLGGFQFEPHFPENDSKIWLWMIIAIVLFIIGIGYIIFTIRRRKQESLEIKPLESSLEEYSQ